MPDARSTFARGFSSPTGLVVVALTMMAVACEPPERESDQWPISLGLLVEKAQAATPADRGLRVYRKACIACHGADGRGNDQKTGADFTRADGVLRQPDAELVRIIREGKKGTIGVMPPHGSLLTEAETTDALVYVRETFGGGIAPSPPAAASGSANGALP